jgi:hypothetical protein
LSFVDVVIDEGAAAKSVGSGGSEATTGAPITAAKSCGLAINKINVNKWIFFIKFSTQVDYGFV